MLKTTLLSYTLLLLLVLASCSKPMTHSEDERIRLLSGKWEYTALNGYIIDEDGNQLEVNKLADVDTSDSETLFFNTNGFYALKQPNYSEVGRYEFRGDTLVFKVGVNMDEDRYMFRFLNDSSFVIHSLVPEENIYICYHKVAY